MATDRVPRRRMGLRAKAPDGAPVVDERTTTGRTVRAVWTRDTEWFEAETPGVLPAVDGSEDQPSFRMALNANDRFNVVHLTSDWRQQATAETGRRVRFEPDPVDVERLMVSGLGGWLDSAGHWDLRPDGLSVEEWRHRAAMGRDHQVRVVRAGFLFPFGHKASLVKLTERKVANGTAYLFQRMFIVVRQPTRSYGAKGLKVDDPAQAARQDERIDLQFPFRTVSVTTRVTPDLEEPRHLITNEGRSTGNLALDGGLGADWLFFPYVDSAPFPFKVLAVDLDHRTVELATPLLFVGAAHNAELDRLRAITRLYDSDDQDGRTTAPLREQRVAMATSDTPDDTAVSISTMTWGGDAPAGLGVGQIVPGFAPRVREASAVVPAVSRLSGNPTPTRIPPGAARVRQPGTRRRRRAARRPAAVRTAAERPRYPRRRRPERRHHVGDRGRRGDRPVGPRPRRPRRHRDTARQRHRRARGCVAGHIRRHRGPPGGRGPPRPRAARP
ncbi:MAG: hypothetical protein WD225_10620 [Ilumatobacteraceae bacterium]